jgi:putative ABC transport system permease protein
MTRHLVRLIWNRKRQNLLLTLEIFCSFLVVFVVALVGLTFTVNARGALGFDIDRVWTIDVSRPRTFAGQEAEDVVAATEARERAIFTRLMAALREQPQIETVAGAFTGPYVNSSWGSGLTTADGRQVDYLYNRVTDDFTTVLSMPIVAGRGFSREDDAAGEVDPVLINLRMARTIFGDVDPVGKIIPEKADPHARSDRPQRRKRVVGVIEAFRQHGKYSAAENVLFERMSLQVGMPAGRNRLAIHGVPERMLIRVKPGTTAALEPVLVRRLQREAADWSFEIATMDSLRERNHREYLVPLAVLAVIAGFLLLMVILGVSGVIWQSVTVRLREFGLRRATGASGVSVRRQVFAEMAVMTTFAVVAGVALLGQIPFLPLPRELLVVVDKAVFAGAVALSAAAIYCLTLACGWYPSRLASRIPPADALRYE